MQNSQLPAKWVKAFAVDDPNKVELPVTTAVTGRASQSLGFPPITMQPPESGGVPPQGEDFNGAMNQVARFVRWYMAGGALPYDNTWTSDSNIGGYPQGARIAMADLLGEWISTADNNTVNPDTVGTNWVPGSAYGATALPGLTNANVTLTPAQAAKPVITLTGVLTGNIQIIFPTWRSEWLVVNNCTGAFSVTVKTAAGAGVVVSQSGGQQTVWGDGTNLNAFGGNAAVPLLVGTATQSQHAATLAQTVGRLIGVQTFGSNGTYTPTVGTKSIIVRAIGGGGAGGGGFATTASSYSVGSGGAAGSYAEGTFVVPGAPISIVVGAGGTGTPGGQGNAGGTTTVGAIVSCPGGGGGAVAAVATGGSIFSAQGAPGGTPTGGNIVAGVGQPGFIGIIGASGPISGQGAPSIFGGGGTNTNSGIGGTAPGRGAGGGGNANQPSQGTTNGAGGAAGWVIIMEYA